MRRDTRRSFAILLTAAAVHGFALAPLVHAVQHAAEADEPARESGLSALWKAISSSGGGSDALAWALEHVHDLARTPAQGTERHSHQHHHSPGPGHGAHGNGTLSHFAVALHAAAQFLAPQRPPPRHLPPRAVEEQLHSAPRYLVPERSQAPPCC